MSVPEAMEGKRWSEATARKVLPLLVAYAEACRCLTYTDIAHEVVRRGWGHFVAPVAYRTVAGAIGFALRDTGEEWEEEIPPINALIVNAKTHLPGEGVDYFVREYLGVGGDGRKLAERDRQAIVEQVHRDIFNYPDWRRLLEEYGLRSPPVLKPGPGGKRRRRRKYGWSSEAEGQAHKRLKQYIAGSPGVVGLPARCAPGVLEYVLPSGDKIDVLFRDKDWVIAVEVKARKAHDDDLRRGIFQCVKYRELLRAEQLTEKRLPFARSLLVTERALPRNLAREAELLKVPCVTVPFGRRSS